MLKHVVLAILIHLGRFLGASAGWCLERLPAGLSLSVFAARRTFS